MKKSLIALTLAALPVAAMADVTLYGQVKAGVEVSQTKFGDKTAEKLGKESKTHVDTSIVDFGSRIGFKGHEHLGNNLNVIWQLEQSASVAGNKAGWGTRNSFIGLEGGFGKVRAGNLDTALKTADKGIDPWEYNNQALGLGVFTRTGERKVSVRYDSPVFAGFSGSVQYQPRDNANPSDSGKHNVPTKDSYYAGLNYENSGFFAQYGGGFRKNSVGDKDGQAHRVIAGYDANNLSVAVGGQYAKNWESLDSYAAAQSGIKNATANQVFGTNAAAGAAAAETVEVAVSAGYRFGNVKPSVSYAHGFKAKAAGEKLKGTQYDQVVVGAEYDFSKRTSALASAGWLRAGESGPHKVETVAGLVGLRHKF